MKNRLKNDIKSFILNWNKKYPIDLWWRNKHKIPFGSKIHKDISFIEMFIEYEEDRLIYLQENPEAVVDSINAKIADEDFDKIDLEDYE